MALATTDDVADAAGRTLSDEEIARAALLLEVATECVLVKTGFRFEAGAHTIGRKVHSGKVRIPATEPDVTEVRYVNQSTGEESVATGYTVRKGTIYGLTDCWAEVDFTVEAEPPAAIVALVAGIVAATVSSPPVGVSQETMGPFVTSYGNSSGRVYLTKSDCEAMARYRQTSKAIFLV